MSSIYKNYPPSWGTGSADYPDPTAWHDEAPSGPVTCHPDRHIWADTGMRKTWCKVCDIEGEWTVNGVVLKGGA